MKNLLFYTILIFLLIGCKSENNTASFSGEFTGYWFDTWWKYTFYENNVFIFESGGHYGYIEGAQGTYERRQDSLFLEPKDSSLVIHGVVNKLCLIDGDSCIIDYELKYDYCKTRVGSLTRSIKYPQIRASKIMFELEISIITVTKLDSRLASFQLSLGQR